MEAGSEEEGALGGGPGCGEGDVGGEEFGVSVPWVGG